MPYRSLKQQRAMWARRNKNAEFNARFKKHSSVSSLEPKKELAVIKQASKLRAQLLKFASTGFVPPPAVASAAARGLELRAKASPSNKGGLTVSQAHQQGIGSGVQRAVDLKNRRALSPETIRRMSAFFSRHQKNKGIAPGKSPEQDKGHIAWLLWGGDPGRAWADSIKSKLDAKSKTKTAGRPSNLKEHLQNALAKYKAGKELGATEEARLKARGLIPRADGSVRKGKLGMDKAAAKSPSKNVPTDPDLWSRAISEAKKRFKIYPSAYANGWAAKWYKERGGSWTKEKQASARTALLKLAKSTVVVAPTKVSKDAPQPSGAIESSITKEDLARPAQDSSAEILSAQKASPIGRALGTSQDVAVMKLPGGRILTAVGGGDSDLSLSSSLPLKKGLSLIRSSVIKPTSGKMSTEAVGAEYQKGPGSASVTFNPASRAVGLSGSLTSAAGSSAKLTGQATPGSSVFSAPSKYGLGFEGELPLREKLGPLKNLKLTGAANVSGSAGKLLEQYGANIGLGADF